MIRKTTLALALVFLFSACSTTAAEESVSYKAKLYEPELFSPVVIPTEQPLELKPLEAVPTPKPKATEKPKATRKPKLNIYKIRYGTASTYGPGYAGYLALPEGRGIRVEVCGPAGCILRTSNDAGPNRAMQRKGRIVDLNVRDFEIVCGCSWTSGLTEVRVRYLRG